MPSSSAKSAAGSATKQYHEALLSPEGESGLHYLLERGLTRRTIEAFKLGLVLDPASGHEAMLGRIAIPYLRPSCVLSIRFRAIDPEVKPKYTQPAGSATYMYGTGALANPGHRLYIAEGEFDAMIASQCGIPCIGIPGAQAWKSHFRSVLDGYSELVVFVDADDQGAGADFAAKIAEDMDDHGVRALRMPEGHDVNSAFLEHGAGWLREYAGLDT